MKNLDIITEDKIISSYKECCLVETVLFWIYVAFAVVASFGCLIQNQVICIFTLLILGTFGYLTVILEHKRQIVFNKENDTLYVTTKALGVKKYKIENKTTLSDITHAEVYKRVRLNPSKNTKSITYGVKLLLKDGKEVYPYGGITSTIYSHWDRICNKINNYLNNDTQLLILKEKPFLFRIVGCLLSSLFFFGCYLAIVP